MVNTNLNVYYTMFAICRVEMGLNVAQDWRMGVAAIEQQLAEDWGVQNGMQEGKGELLHGNTCIIYTILSDIKF